MNKKVSIVLAGLILGMGIFSTAYAEQKIAVVDVQAIVNKSAQVQALKKEQQTKLKDLEKWLNTAKADVEKQQTEAGKEKLLKKYNDDFAKKKETIAKDYQTKIQAIDTSISNTIAQQAKLKGYNMVIAKGTVVYFEPADDITEDVKKVVK